MRQVENPHNVLSLFFTPREGPVMPHMTPALEPVPAAEVAAVLAEAVLRATGGPVFAAGISGQQLATALDLAGFLVLRQAAPSRQLKLWED